MAPPTQKKIIPLYPFPYTAPQAQKKRFANYTAPKAQKKQFVHYTALQAPKKKLPTTLNGATCADETLRPLYAAAGAEGNFVGG